MRVAKGHRWSAERATKWWAGRPWVCGFNFLPSTAVNFLEMWMEHTFDRDTIARELGWASAIGFNAVRVNTHFLVWKYDRDGYHERMNWFLQIASDLGLSTVIVPFDDCEFGGEAPVYGPQPDPLPEGHNGRAVGSPGRDAVRDRSQWPEFESYLRDTIRTHRDDPRILFWDIYNEPSNDVIFRAREHAFYEGLTEHSRDLMLKCFEWARDENPVHPLTVGAWRTPPAGTDEQPYDNEIDQLALANSDIITFHAYADRSHIESYLDYLETFGRPMVATEWMARAAGSTFGDQLELYRNRNVGCFNWGLVAGRTQTNLPWPDEFVERHGGEAARDIWFHDVLRPDGSAYDATETQLISTLTRSIPDTDSGGN